MKQSYACGQDTPYHLYRQTKSLFRRYRAGIRGGYYPHPPFDIENNTNLIERMYGTIKSRTKVMRGLHSLESAKKYLSGWLVHYNYYRPHMSLKDSTPARLAGIQFSFRNWKDICEQPYELTARISVLTPELARQKAKTSKRKKIIKRTSRNYQKLPTVIMRMRS